MDAWTCYLFIFLEILIANIFSWAKRRLDEALIYLKKMLHKLAVAVRDSILWPFCLLLVALLKQVCLYRLFNP